VPVIDGVFRSGGANYAVSDTGVLAYLPGPAQSDQDKVIVYDRKGSVKVLPLPRGTYQNPRVSPDGKRLAIETNDGNHSEIALYELSGGNSITQLTYDGNNRMPVWSADSKRVAFQSDRNGDRGIFWQSIDGGVAERLTHPEPGTFHTPESWAPSSDLLLFSLTNNTETTLWTFSTTSRKASRFDDVISFGMPTDAVFSPDGRWIAYQIGGGPQTGDQRGGTYIQPFPPTGMKYQAASGGRPLWSPNGRELFFVPAPGQFSAVTIRMQPTFTVSSPVDVPRRFTLAFPGNPRPYDVLPDGSFVAVGAATGGEQGPPQIQVVLNWFEELKQKLPAAK
jgi:Tol biopolymer transport system component